MKIFDYNNEDYLSREIRVLNAEIAQLHLEDPCPLCGGSGLTGKPANPRCGRCRGRGLVPSELGEQFIQFIRNYASRVL